MPRPFHAPSAESLDRVRALTERRLTAEELKAGLAAPMADQERQQIISLIRWFRRRYPTPGERLASARRAHAQWAKSQPKQP